MSDVELMLLKSDEIIDGSLRQANIQDSVVMDSILRTLCSKRATCVYLIKKALDKVCEALFAVQVQEYQSFDP